jgi:hypothetical protein
VLPLLPDLSHPICIDGKLACPPEDCGGIPGYCDLIEAIADPDMNDTKKSANG